MFQPLQHEDGGLISFVNGSEQTFSKLVLSKTSLSSSVLDTGHTVRSRTDMETAITQFWNTSGGRHESINHINKIKIATLFSIVNKKNITL